MNPNKMLIETWMSDPKDTESICRFGREPLSEKHLKVPVNIHKAVTPAAYNFAQFVGFYTAHVVWYLEGLDGENVSPLLTVQKAGEAWIEHFESTAYESAVAKARELYDTMPLSNGDYVLLAYDGFLTRGGKRDESLFIQAFERRYQEEMTYRLIVPYSSVRNTGSLLIGQIEISPPSNLPDCDKNIFLNNFKNGAYSHTKGFEFWSKHWGRNLEPILIRE